MWPLGSHEVEQVPEENIVHVEIDAVEFVLLGSSDEILVAVTVVPLDNVLVDVLVVWGLLELKVR